MEYNELIQGFTDRYGIQDVSTADGVTTFEIDEIPVSLIHDETASSVTVYGEIGFPPPDTDGSFGGLMLKANHLFTGTGGSVLCQNPETGAFAVFRNIPLAELDLNGFCIEVGKLVDQAEYWRKIKDGFLQAEEEAEVSDMSAEIEPLSPNSFIQV
jgi:hypothetical protein